MSDTMKIGQVAKAAGVGVDTLRYYEQRGLIPEPARTASRYRAYPPNTVDRVQFIKRAQELGFTLSEIGDLLALSAADEVSCQNVRLVARDRLAQLDEKIERLTAMRKALAALTEICPGHLSDSDCPIIDYLTNPPKGLPPTDHQDCSCPE